jgi:hypothetical protein
MRVRDSKDNRTGTLSLRAMLANNLLSDPDAPGRLRRIGVGISGSVFYPRARSQE